MVQVLPLVLTDSGFGNNGQQQDLVEICQLLLIMYLVDGMPSDQNDPSTWHYIVDNGTNTWWRNSLANNTDGIVNRLMRGNNAVNPGPFATVEFQINIPISKCQLLYTTPPIVNQEVGYEVQLVKVQIY